MKKYSILIIMAFTTLMFSCGSDDENPSVKCLECDGAEKICVGDVIDANDASLGNYDEQTLQALADLANALVPGACTFE